MAYGDHKPDRQIKSVLLMDVAKIIIGLNIFENGIMNVAFTHRDGTVIGSIN